MGCSEFWAPANALWMMLMRIKVYLGSKEVSKEVKNAKALEEANAWLSTMR